jgi:hypothetical protein
VCQSPLKEKEERRDWIQQSYFPEPPISWSLDVLEHISTHQQQKGKAFHFMALLSYGI